MRRNPTLSERVAALVLLAGVVLLASVVVVSFAVVHLNDSVRTQVDRLDPAQVAAEDLLNALVNEETGDRGYILARSPSFLQPYRLGLVEQRSAERRLQSLLQTDPSLERRLHGVEKAAAKWRDRVATPTIAATRAHHAALARRLTDTRGKSLFDAFRRSIQRLASGLKAAHASADQALTNADRELIALLAVCLAAMLAMFELVWVFVRRWVTQPVARMATDVRAISAGDFHHLVESGGAPELRSLATDVGSMRDRIVDDLAAADLARTQLASQTAALEASNAELEQFAYVASHDLQEPLRKMASFSDLVERRYGDTLDDRGKEYLGFIADGARRMQALINDILDLSRVGRSGRPMVDVDLGSALQAAMANLQGEVDRTGATFTTEGLPVVRGDRPLLTAVFQNLVGNSLKFTSDAAPVIDVRAAAGPDPDTWEISVADNGIGVDAGKADRIFAMFQRLHRRDDYPGTGIGLALCRRIVEYHGGQIWLDVGYGPGTRICFSLPRRSTDGAT